ncbi:MAG: hypothetical protein ACRDGN_17235 [bacterium]
MAADLVSLVEVKAWLGITDASQDILLTDLADRVEAILEGVKGRTYAPSAATVATLDGTGTPWLWLELPVGTLTNVKIGLDPAAPDETLTPAPRTIVAQGRRLYRQDGGIFPRGIANIQATYTSAASLDKDAKQAVLEGVALAYRMRGSEDAASESIGAFGHGLRQAFEELPSWKAVPSRPVLA